MNKAQPNFEGNNFDHVTEHFVIYLKFSFQLNSAGHWWSVFCLFQYKTTIGLLRHFFQKGSGLENL